MSDEKKGEDVWTCQTEMSKGEDRTPEETVKLVQEFAGLLAREVIAMSPGVTALEGTADWGRAVAICDTMASIAFLLGCMTKLGCDLCDDGAKKDGFNVISRFRHYIAQIITVGMMTPPKGTPIH